MLDSIFEKGLVSFIFLTIFTILQCYLLYWFISRYIDRHSDKFSSGIQNGAFMRDTVKVIIWGIGMIIILGQIKPLKPLGDTMLGAGGILAIGTSIAAQTTFGNYIAGFFLAIHHPFKVGDYVYLKEKGVSGTVLDVTFRHTTIETAMGTILTIPNTVMNNAMIEDLSRPGYVRNLEFRVDNATDLGKLTKVIDDILSKNELCINKDVQVSIEEFNGSSYLVSFPLCARSLKEYNELKNAIIPDLIKAFRKHKITVI